MTKFRAFFTTIRLYKKIILFLVYFILALILRENPRETLATADMTNYCYIPTTITTSAPPNVMIMLSIETPMQGTAHPPITCTGDPRTSYGCTFASCSYTVSERRVDNCYDNNKTYYGYFDPNKCYTYTGGGVGARFEPIGSTTNHQCSGSWSGNFLNWATTMAVDAFRKAMTGGNRAVDSTGHTQLLGARQTLPPGDNWFPVKRIDNANFYTPYTGTIYLIRYANGFVVCRNPDCTVGESGSGENLFPTVSDRRCSNDPSRACNTDSDCGSGARCQTVSGALDSFNLKIEVCNTSKGLEPNCNPSNNKPEGVIQKYADKMRFGLISYALSGNPDRTRDGGVIRANMKWISPKIPYGMKYHDANGDLVVCNNTGGCPNPEAEINPNGTFISNPDNIGGVDFSGVINYINKFGYNAGYKSYDPISEMYYEIIRYFKKLGPSTDNYCNGLPTKDDGAPVYCSSSPWSHTNRLGWRDPYIEYCQKSFVVAINDANPWLDKRIPGTAKTSDTPCIQCVGDFGAPSNADTSINVSYWTDFVGNYEGLTPGNMCIGCVLGGSCDWSANQKYVNQLSKAFGTCPWPPKENSYYIAGLAYYAHQTDLRPDLQGNQTLKTYMIDTQEANPNMLVGRINMLYLAAKFGNFDDTNGNGRPDLTSEWDKDGDGFPDAYFFASDPTKIEEGLIRAFSDILRRASSGATVATLSQRVSTGALVLQPYFYPRYQAGDVELSWIGFLKALWVDAKGRIREDTVADKILKLLEDLWVQFVSTSSGTKIFALSNETSCTATERNTPEDVPPLFEAGCKLAETNPGNRKVYVNKDGALVSLTDYALTSYLQAMWNDIAGKSLNATCIINYILGQDNPCPANSNTTTFVSRPRTANISSLCPGSSGNRTWKLGDIYHSTPVVLSYEPLNNYHLRYGDSSYLTYINSDSYRKRTTYVFVGANDGMLHAFRVGWLSAYNPPNEPLKLTDAFSLTSTALIGKEEWAFIPRNALPYLLWLGHKDYCHVPTVDYRVSVFDVKDPNTGQWRTYLLGMMGFGGKAISANGTTYSSSLFLLDLTDWLNGTSDRPTLKWEITLPDNTLTLSYPQVVKLSNSTDWSKTYIVIGSGPKEVTGTGTPYTISFVSQPKIYFIRLADGGIVANLTIPDNNKAVGHLRTVDFDNDYVDDLIYFGTYNETSGNLYRISFKNPDGSYKDVSSLTNSDIKSVFSSYLGKPVFAAPQMTFDQSRNLWVIFGTGQYLTRNYPSTNYFIGLKETCYLGNCTLNFSDLVDHTDYCTNNSNYNATLLYNSTERTCTCTETGCSQTSEGASYQFIYSLAPNGWYHVLTSNEQMYSSVFILNYMVNALSFRPTQDICSSGGETYYWMVCLVEGCPCYSLRGETSPVVSKFIAFGAPPIGQPFQPLKTEKGTTLLTQTSAGGIIQTPNPLRATLRGKFILWIEK